MKHLILLIIAVPLFFGCNSTKNTSANSIALITFEKTKCRGQCPVYSLAIFENGLVKYIGVENVEKIGKYERTLSKSKIKELKQAFSQSNFFDFENEYTSKVTDLPSTYISYSYKGQTKKIRDYYGSPEKLKALEEMLIIIAQCEEGWKKTEE